MRINRNLASLNIYKNYVKDMDNQSSSVGRISSGVKINSAKDGAGALARSERLRIQIASMQIAARNTQDGISLIQTAESGADSISNAIQRIRELVVSSGGGTSDGDKKIIQTEIEQLKQEIDGFARNTDFNGLTPLNDAGESVKKMPVGANSGEVIEVPLYNLKTSNLKDSSGNTIASIDLTKGTTIDKALNILDGSTKKINDVRSKYGAISNRFEECYNDLNEFSDRLQGTESSVRDTDIAEEMMNYAKNSLLVEASQAMLVQTNKFPQDVLRILENVRSR